MGIDDNSFSQKLRLHASSLDLNLIKSVGSWDFGQSIRRAIGDAYFYDLSLSHFWPLGLNHPLSLGPESTDPSPQSFRSELVALLPHLEKLQWVVLCEKSYLDFKKGHPVLEKSGTDLDSIWGWKFLEEKQPQSFCVEFADASYWVCSTDPLPNSSLLKHHSWLNLFLSSTILGPQGRLVAVQSMLKRVFNLPEISGLNLSVSLSSDLLDTQGIKVRAKSAHESLLHFPVSVLKSDIEKVKQLVEQARNSVC